MQTTTVLLIILAAFGAFAFAFFQYYAPIKKKNKLHYFLALLRTLSIFGILLLMINPEFTKTEYSVEKTNLIVLTDNSTSMKLEEEKVNEIITYIEKNSDLNKGFKIQKYVFGAGSSKNQDLSFTEKNTNIAKALKSLKEVYANTNSAVVLLTDGNATIGEDYVFSETDSKFPVYPIAIGDTTQYEDLRIDQINSNKYAFLKNKYPLEIYLSYNGNREVKSTLNITVNGKNVYRKNLEFSNSKTTETINTVVNASSIGIKNVAISVTPLKSERNIQNNKRNVVVEVIDEKTNIAIISGISHPDIGALRKSIESNEQRTVQIKKPNVNLNKLNDVDVFVLYQPNRSFNGIYEYIKQKKVSAFIMGGMKADWRSLNNALPEFDIQTGYPQQEVFGVLNQSFTKFDISNFSLEDFPPLESNVAPISIGNDSETLIQMRIQGKTMQSALLAASEVDNVKKVVLFGENLWKWRMQSFRNAKNFENFDDFIGKIMRYLSSNQRKNRLSLEYKTIYEGSNEVMIRASYFDEAFVFDSNASLTLTLTNKQSKNTQETPMLLKNNFYESDLTDVLPGEYSFTVSVNDENRSQSGSFTILDFDVEKQFLSTNYKKLEQLALTTNGKLFFPNKTDNLIQNLQNDTKFIPTQKSTKNIVSLIDFRVLLALIVAAIAAEWFIRKYNGLT